MNFIPVKKTSIADDVVNQLKGMIVNQKIKIGDQLPNERELSTLFNVSRSSVREALRSLELQGLLNRTNSGTFVQANFSDIIQESLTLELLLNSAKYDDIQVTRIMLERELIGLATQRRSTTHLDNIKSYIEQMENSILIHDKEEFVNADIAFHTEIAIAADNFVLLYLFNAISDLIFKVQKRVVFDENVISASLDYHKLIYEALVKQDALLAKEHLVNHLQDVVKRIDRLNEMEKIALEEFNNNN